LGAIANINDVMTGFNPRDIGNVDLVTEHSDEIGHSAIVRTGTVNNDSSIISFGPDEGEFSLNPFIGTKGKNTWSNYTGSSKPIWRTNITGINKSKITSYGLRLSNDTPDYNLYFSSCVTHTSMALARSGFLNIGIHPYLLHAQAYLRELGLRTYFSHYLQN